jgi:two-component system response regulator RstA
MKMTQEEKLPRILIVEDDERLATLTQDYLTRNGL